MGEKGDVTMPENRWHVEGDAEPPAELLSRRRYLVGDDSVHLLENVLGGQRPVDGLNGPAERQKGLRKWRASA